VRLRARRLLQYLDDNDAADLAPELALVMKDQARGKDRVEAIRALAALGREESIVELINILMTSDELAVRDAAMVALVRCSGKQVGPGDPTSFYNAIDQALTERASKEQRKQIMDEFNAPRDALGSGVQRMQRLSDENSAILPPETQHLGGGGFF
jgi:hypothetical protein